jgi:methylated-DNA-[protein]-cysteine S-methyltransferase
MTYYMTLSSPIGNILLISDGDTLTGLYFDVYKNKPKIQPDWIQDDAQFSTVAEELTDYLNGKRQTFSLSVQQRGTAFQESVWREVAKIPYGKKKTYKEIAEAIGRPKAVRAVGTAVGSNPVCIIGPCHRVIPTSGGLGGYAGGLEAKTFLLALES